MIVKQSVGYPAGSALDSAAQHHTVSVRLRGRIQTNSTIRAPSLLLPRRDDMAELFHVESQDLWPGLCSDRHC